MRSGVDFGFWWFCVVCCCGGGCWLWGGCVLTFAFDSLYIVWYSCWFAICSGRRGLLPLSADLLRGFG